MSTTPPKGRVFHVLAWISIAILVWLSFQGGEDISRNEYPNKPIKVIVPFKAGGGSDVLVRMFQRTIKEKNLLPVPFVIYNKNGAGGSRGSRYVKGVKPDGYTILNLHDAMMISKKLNPTVFYGPEAFECVAGTVVTDLVVVVKDDSPYQNLQDLMNKAKEEPEKIVFGCAFGTPTEVTGLLMQKAVPGAKFNMINAGGGSARFEQITGGAYRCHGVLCGGIP